MIAVKTILLKFSGPLQSWGTSSNFETRHTDYHPSKSAVIGMIAASFGYKRDETEQIQKLNGLDFAVRIDRQGTLLRDYHTAKKYKKTGELERTYVTQRYYLQDAIFLVAIAHEDEVWMEEIETALKNPYFQQFMGRRSLPLPADFFLGVSHSSPIEILMNHEPLDSKTTVAKLPIYADADLIEGTTQTMRKDRVLSFSQQERKFGFRGEALTYITVSEPEHDAFEAIGE